jgi:hypothetical protein
MTRIRLPSQTEPPRGAIESPNTVVIRDPVRSVRRDRNSATRDWLADSILIHASLERNLATVYCDTNFFKYL